MSRKKWIASIVSLVFPLIIAGGVLGEDRIKVFNLTTSALEDIDSLSSEQLTIKVLPLPIEGYAVYLTFPDGGNMLIDTGKNSDAARVVSLLKKEITEGEKKYGLMSVLGWKPRIDWLILTSASPDRAGGFEKVLTSFKVRKVVSYAALDKKKMVKDSKLEARLRRLADIMLSLNIDHITANSEEEIDLEQVVSPIRLTALYSKDNLNLRFVYSRFSFVYLSDADAATQSEIAAKFGDSLKSTVLYTSFPVTDEFNSKITPNFILRNSENVTLVTDGSFLRIEPESYLVKK